MDDPAQICKHYFVDEAGDTTLFAKGGRVLVGTDNCSKCFMLGVAQIPHPEEVTRRLEELRKKLMADPYFANVPSMQANASKTAVSFHAKDDCPEVRREVFQLIESFGAVVTVAVRRKSVLAELGLQARRLGTKAAIGPNDLYDDLVTKLFRHGQLVSADRHEITFARRGKRARIEALANAIDKAKEHGEQQQGCEAKPCSITARFPSDCGGLQVIDYYLWALQRMFERNEARYFNYVKEHFQAIIDLDDTTNKPSGEWYVGRERIAELAKKSPLVS